MKNKIEYMAYSRDSNADINKIAVQRDGVSDPMRFYRNITKSTLKRFVNLQDKSQKVVFMIDSGIIEFHIMLRF